MIILIGANKGGVGKSTTTVNLAVAFAQQGKDVCLVDTDPQRTASRWLAEREAAGLTPTPTLIERRDNITVTLKTLKEKFDVVLVDVPGRNSRELVTGMVAADLVIAPHQCSQADLDTLSELRQQVIQVRDLNPGLKVLAYHTMASTNISVRDTEREEFLAFLGEFPEIDVLEARSCYRKEYRDALSEGRSVLEGDNDKAREEVEQLLQEVMNHG